MNRDPRIDAYIANAAPFAQPVLTRLRAAFHQASPDLVEAIKWGMPALVYKGVQVVNFAAFKAHATCNFWSREVVGDAVLPAAETAAMGQFGRITSEADLPDDATLTAMMARAVAAIDAGAKRTAPLKKAKPAIAMPNDFAAALAATNGARAHFDSFPPGAQRDYLEWVTTAKQAATRSRRIAQAAAWIGDGKRYDWKYNAC